MGIKNSAKPKGMKKSEVISKNFLKTVAKFQLVLIIIKYIKKWLNFDYFLSTFDLDCGGS